MTHLRIASLVVPLAHTTFQDLVTSIEILYPGALVTHVARGEVADALRAWLKGDLVVSANANGIGDLGTAARARAHLALGGRPNGPGPAAQQDPLGSEGDGGLTSDRPRYYHESGLIIPHPKGWASGLSPEDAAAEREFERQRERQGVPTDAPAAVPAVPARPSPPRLNIQAILEQARPSSLTPEE